MYSFISSGLNWGLETRGNPLWSSLVMCRVVLKTAIWGDKVQSICLKGTGRFLHVECPLLHRPLLPFFFPFTLSMAATRSPNLHLEGSDLAQGDCRWTMWPSSLPVTACIIGCGWRKQLCGYSWETVSCWTSIFFFYYFCWTIKGTVLLKS